MDILIKIIACFLSGWAIADICKQLNIPNWVSLLLCLLFGVALGNVLEF
jgi:Flp pilus assembly protein protease CpaA